MGTGFPPARSPWHRSSCGLTLRRAKAGRKTSCSNNNLERDGDSKKSHHALMHRSIDLRILHGFVKPIVAVPSERECHHAAPQFISTGIAAHRPLAAITQCPRASTTALEAGRDDDLAGPQTRGFGRRLPWQRQAGLRPGFISRSNAGRTNTVNAFRQRWTGNDKAELFTDGRKLVIALAGGVCLKHFLDVPRRKD